MQDTTYVVHKNSYGLHKNVMGHLAKGHLSNYMWYVNKNKCLEEGVLFYLQIVPSSLILILRFSSIL